MLKCFFLNVFFNISWMFSCWMFHTILNVNVMAVEMCSSNSWLSWKNEKNQSFMYLKLSFLRLVQARRNREIAILQRKIDEVPSRAELTQYQKRFIELYSQGGKDFTSSNREETTVRVWTNMLNLCSESFCSFCHAQRDEAVLHSVQHVRRQEGLSGEGGEWTAGSC